MSRIFNYDVELCELLDADGKVIGADLMLLQRDEEGDLIDCLADDVAFIDGKDFADVINRHWIVEEEFDSLLNAHEAFHFHARTLIDYNYE